MIRDFLHFWKNCRKRNCFDNRAICFRISGTLTYLVIISILGLFIMAGSCGTRHRLNIGGAIEVMREIRTAEFQFKASEGRYGSLKELESSGLVTSDRINHQQYQFTFKVEIDEYSVLATPPPNEHGLSLFMDETGVIRAGENGTATAKDEAIKMQ